VIFCCSYCEIRVIWFAANALSWLVRLGHLTTVSASQSQWRQHFQFLVISVAIPMVEFAPRHFSLWFVFLSMVCVFIYGLKLIAVSLCKTAQPLLTVFLRLSVHFWQFGLCFVFMACHCLVVWRHCYLSFFIFVSVLLRATAGCFMCLSHRLGVCLSLCHTLWLYQSGAS